MKPIRNSAKAIIIKDGKLLCIKKESETGEIYYILPGGGQEPGENLFEALIRECREEVNGEIEIGELRFIRDYIGKNHEFKEKHAEFHGLNLMFICNIKNANDIKNGCIPDDKQVGIEWLDIKNLPQYNLYPKVLKTLIKQDGIEGPIYLGDVN